MYIEIHNHDDKNQEWLYFKLNNAFNMDTDEPKNIKHIGIYAIFNGDTCLYVGQSKNLSSRIATHLRGKYEKATHIKCWDIREIGFSDYLDRLTMDKKSILDNVEKYVMTLLQPIDNVDIDMDFRLKGDTVPAIDIHGDYSFLVAISEYFITITDSCSLAIDDIYTGVDYLDAFDKLDRKYRPEVLSIIRQNDVSTTDFLSKRY